MPQNVQSYNPAVLGDATIDRSAQLEFAKSQAVDEKNRFIKAEKDLNDLNNLTYESWSQDQSNIDNELNDYKNEKVAALASAPDNRLSLQQQRYFQEKQASIARNTGRSVEDKKENDRILALVEKDQSQEKPTIDYEKTSANLLAERQKPLHERNYYNVIKMLPVVAAPEEQWTTKTVDAQLDTDTQSESTDGTGKSSSIQTYNKSVTADNFLAVPVDYKNNIDNKKAANNKAIELGYDNYQEWRADKNAELSLDDWVFDNHSNKTGLKTENKTFTKTDDNVSNTYGSGGNVSGLIYNGAYTTENRKVGATTRSAIPTFTISLGRKGKEDKDSKFNSGHTGIAYNINEGKITYSSIPLILKGDTKFKLLTVNERSGATNSEAAKNWISGDKARELLANEAAKKAGADSYSEWEAANPNEATAWFKEQSKGQEQLWLSDTDGQTIPATRSVIAAKASQEGVTSQDIIDIAESSYNNDAKIAKENGDKYHYEAYYNSNGVLSYRKVTGKYVPPAAPAASGSATKPANATTATATDEDI